MRRIVLLEPAQLQLQSAEPPVPGPGEALVRVRRIGICGTDLHAYQGRQPFFSYPRVLGHEISAEVVVVGDNPDGLKVGEVCVVSPYLYCGVCGACRQGKTNCCARLKVLGVHVDGGLQDLITVPAHALVRADSLSVDQMAMVENQSIGAHAVRRAQIQPGETALVIGAGPIGFGVAQFARLAGAEVLVADLSAARLEMARRWLAPRQALEAGPELEAQLAGLTGGDLPTVVFDCTGSPGSMMQAFRYVANGGRLVLVGLAQADITFHDPEFHRRETTLLSSRNATRADFQHVIASMAAGRVVTEPLTTARVALDDLIPAFPNWLKPEAGVLKALVELN
jgi:2-desacetyl-2-hydroxyethyl bacteriochlorophyllide A dehydrogenase